MAGYKVSYKILRQQGDDIKAVAKLVDGYIDRVGKIRAKLGADDMLAEVRGNLQKLESQLGESRAILSAAGEFLVKTVDSYTGMEVRQVKKVDATKAHNRDFYKNPVVVASAGGAAAGAAAVAATPQAAATGATAINYIDNSVNVTHIEVTAAPADVSALPVEAAAQPAADLPADIPAVSEASSGGAASAGAVVAGAVGGAAAGAGATVGAMHLKNRKAGEQDEDAPCEPDDAPTEDDCQPEDSYDPEVELAKAIQRVKDLEQDQLEEK